jgi:hypothetical protein
MVTIELQPDQDVNCTFENYNKGLEEGAYLVFLPTVLRK